jgi:hypothetical protein
MTTYSYVNQIFIWLCKKNMDHHFPFKEFLSFSKRLVTSGISQSQYAFVGFRWAWISCQFKSNWVSTTIWAKRDHFTFTY